MKAILRVRKPIQRRKAANILSYLLFLRAKS